MGRYEHLVRVLACVVGVLAGGAGGPVINVAVADFAFGGPGNMGTVMSLASSSTAEQCGRVAAPLLISYSYDQISSDAAFLVGGATLWLSAGALACVALVSTGSRHHQRPL